MKKVKKNIALKKNNVVSGNIQEGKVKKNKQVKKIKDALTKIKKLKLAPKLENTDLVERKTNGANGIKKNKKDKTKSAKPKDTQEYSEKVEKSVNVEHTNKLQKKQKISKNDKHKPENSETKVTTDSRLSIIDRKKVKNLAKLKNRQKLKESKNVNKSAAASTNEQKEETLGNGVIKTVVTKSSKVLMKKEKKAQIRQLIKNRKLSEKQTRDPELDAATIFVGNLPVNTKRIQLVRLFESFGPIRNIRLRSAGGNILYKHKQRKSAGSLNAYLVFTNKKCVEKAISMNGKEFKGNHLRVTLAENSVGNLTSEETKKRTIFVGNLKYSATEESLREIFDNCGEIEYVRCIRDGDKGCKGVAYVCFKSADAVGLALELNKTILDDRPISVERFSVKKLGAKKARVAQSENKNSKNGIKQKLEGKKGKRDKSGPKKQSYMEGDDGKTPKKSEFRGVKVESLKKKQKSKKKKSNDQMVQLAKKIAPKPKPE